MNPALQPTMCCPIPIFGVGGEEPLEERPGGSTPYVVVIFGRTGVGVSSLVNLITGLPVSKDDADAKSCTQKLRRYHITLPDSTAQFCVYEVPGFNGHYADKTILDEIRKIEQKERIDLFVYCLRKQKATVMPKVVRQVKENVTTARVPIIAAVTELEKFDGEGGMEAWWTAALEDGGTNGAWLENMCSGRFDAHACIKTLPPRDVDLNQLLRKRREQSEERIRRLVVELCGRCKRTS